MILLCYSLNRMSSRTIIREMPVNERGELVENWPDGFFGEYIEEVF